MCIKNKANANLHFILNQKLTIKIWRLINKILVIPKIDF